MWSDFNLSSFVVALNHKASDFEKCAAIQEGHDLDYFSTAKKQHCCDLDHHGVVPIQQSLDTEECMSLQQNTNVNHFGVTIKKISEFRITRS